MGNNTNKNSGEEMDQIQQGLERFLAKEMNGYESLQRSSDRSSREINADMLPESQRQTSVSARTKKRAEPEIIDWDDEDGNEDWDDGSEESMAQGMESLTEEMEDDIDEELDRKTKAKASGPAPTPRKKKKRKKKSFLRRTLGRLVAVILVLCLAGGVLWYGMVGKFYGAMNYSAVDTVTAEPMKEDGVINILLIGNDSREAGEDGRSDAMILLSISNETKSIVMLSLLRDMYVEIPGHNDNRLNAAYAYGGAELLMETLEHNLDIEVHRYVQVNFQAFAGLVDAVGGVDLELSNEEVQYVNGYLTEYNVIEGRPEGTDYMDSAASGLLHLNGPQALAYCRIRYIGSDFARTQRQRDVLMAVIKKAPKALLTNAGELMNGLLPNLTTNLTEAECRSLSLQVFNLARYELAQTRIPIDGSYSNAKIDGKSVLEVDFEKNKEFIRQAIYGE